jgi:prepilin-type N-terminal cleavage/methylation domain-containing protein
MNPRDKKQNGFTLIELIIVIVLLGILGAMGAGFISEAFKGFFDTDVRMEMYEEGKSALVRMEREIHIALPNAIDVTPTGDTISFGVIDETAMGGVFGQYEEEHPTGDTFITDRAAALETGLVSIYNTGWDVFIDGSRIYNISSTDVKKMDFAPETIGPASPYGRYYAIRPEAVRFIIENRVLNRRTTEVTTGGITVANFSNDALATPQPMARNVDQITNLDFFTYTPGTSTRNSVVSIHFAISRNGETVNFHKEVQVRNVP